MEALRSKRSHNQRLSVNMLNEAEYIGGDRDVFKEGNVVKSLTIGNTRIKICDDYCRDRTTKDIQAILKRIAIRAQAQITAHANIDK